MSAATTVRFSVVMFALIVAALLYGADSRAESRICWVENDSSVIASTRLDGSDLKIHFRGLHSPNRFAYDPDSKTFYWSSGEGLLSSGQFRMSTEELNLVILDFLLDKAHDRIYLAGHTLYKAEEGRLVAIDLSDRSASTLAKFEHCAWSVEYDASNNRTFVGVSNDIVVIDPNTADSNKKFKLKEPADSMSYVNSSDRLYLCSVVSESLRYLDLATGLEVKVPGRGLVSLAIYADAENSVYRSQHNVGNIYRTDVSGSPTEDIVPRSALITDIEVINYED